MSSTTSTSKERHYAHLASQLQILSSNMINAQNNIAAAAEQAKYIRNLGAGQASIFMAALHQVDQENVAQEGEPIQPHQS
ncbi:hypothetical protein CBS101457_002096 [Exobasidium rhododendri]|nr:hypothetical protein CBS101457_002096 [Exobasidium rhododendri]